MKLLSNLKISSLHPSHTASLRAVLLLLFVLLVLQVLAWMMPVVDALRGISGYLPLHTLLETVAIVISMLVFAVGWNSHNRNLSGNIVLLACVFFAVGWLDFAHTLSYTGMPEWVTPSHPEKGLQFWLAARFLASLALLVVALRSWRPFVSGKTRYLLMTGVIAFVLFVHWLVLRHQDDLPHTFISGQGLTPLKKNLEYFLILLNLLTALLFWLKMRKAQPFKTALLFGAVCVMGMSEYFFTLYSSMTDIFNLLGHVYKVVAYLLIYRAIVVEGIETPYRKLDEARKNLTLAVQASNTGLWDWNLNTDEVYYSPEWKAQLGYLPDELNNHFSTWDALLHLDDKPQALRKLHEYMASTDKYYENEFRLQHKDGSYRWILARGEKQYDSAGKAIRLVGSHIDISSRKRDEERFRSAVEATPNAMLIVNEQRHIILLNSKTCTLFGYNKEELIGQSINILLAPQYRHAHTKYVSDYIQHRSDNPKMGVGRDLFGQHKDGRQIPVEISLTPLQTNEGNCVIASIIDITERKESEEKIKNYQEHLEDEVAQRTLELLKARDTAERANRAKSVFLANMSHELRTPMNAILGFAQLLQRDSSLGEASRKQLDTINRAGQHLLALINDVLEISRIEAGRSVIQTDAFSLSNLLNSTEEMMRFRAEDKGLDFRVEHAADLPQFVESDEQHLKQVLINLLGNAIKYTEHGHVRFSVTRRQDHIQFAISDSGPGIDSQDLERIFDAFYQTEGGIAKGEGTGLGLAISREYARLMGGTLTVESTVGTGSSFILSLPLPEAAAPVQATVARRVIGLEAGQEGLRVLVADDMKENRELLKLLMEMTGFDVRTAENGEQAIEQFESWHPDFIWMDMRMPVLDGYQAVSQIRKLAGGDKVKIVAITASAFAEERKTIIEAGCNDVVSKPFEQAHMFAVLAEQLGVKYRYAEASKEQVVNNSVLDLSSLPVELLHELSHAAQALDLRAVRGIVNRIAELQPQIAARLDQLVQGFRLDYIATACDKVVKTGVQSTWQL